MLPNPRRTFRWRCAARNRVVRAGIRIFRNKMKWNIKLKVNDTKPSSADAAHHSTGVFRRENYARVQVSPSLSPLLPPAPTGIKGGDCERDCLVSSVQINSSGVEITIVRSLAREFAHISGLKQYSPSRSYSCLSMLEPRESKRACGASGTRVPRRCRN